MTRNTLVLKEVSAGPEAGNIFPVSFCCRSTQYYDDLNQLKRYSIEVIRSDRSHHTSLGI